MPKSGRIVRESPANGRAPEESEESDANQKIQPEPAAQDGKEEKYEVAVHVHSILSQMPSRSMSAGIISSTLATCSSSAYEA